MARINLTGGSYEARGASVACQRVLNLYPEPIIDGSGEPVQTAYYPTPGLAKVSAPGGACRCAYRTTQGQALFVMGASVVLLGPGGDAVQLGSISSGTGPVRMSDNGVTLFIVDGTDNGGWYCSMPTTSPTLGMVGYGEIKSISDPAFYGSATIAILDTFFLFVNPKTTNWYTSPAMFADEASTPFDSLYVASDSTSLTTLVAVEVVGQYIWLFGTVQAELWYDSGAADFPFQRVQGVTIEAGAASPYAIARVPSCAAAPNGGIIWLSQDRSGASRVYFGQQTLAVPVSTFAIDGALQAMGDVSAAVANIYQQDGHIFYVLTVPGQSSAWVYDVSTGLWHERCAMDGSGNEVAIRPGFWCQAYGKIWAGDRENGLIYEVSLSADDDAGTSIKRQRAFPHLLTNGTRSIHRQFTLDMQNGSGIAVDIDWSDDRGASFGPAQTLSLGATGNVWPSLYRLGIARDRVYRITWAAAAQTALMGAFVNVDPVRT